MRFLVKLFGGYTKQEFEKAKEEGKREAERDLILKDSKITILEEKINSKENEIEEKNSQKQRELKLKDEMISSKTEEVESLRKRLNQTQTSFDENIKRIQEDKEKQVNESLTRAESEKEKAISEMRLDFEKKLKNAGYIGEMQEEELAEKLTLSFANDNISKIGKKDTKGKGDVVQSVVNSQKQKVGEIVYEVKNRATWEYKEYDKFIKKIQDNKDEIISINIFVTKDNVFPSLNGSTQAKYNGIKEVSKNLLYFDELNNIYLTSISNIMVVAYLLRNKLVDSYEENDENIILSQKDIVFEYFTSDDFKFFVNNISNTFNMVNETIDKNIKSLNKLKSNIASSDSDVRTLDNNVSKALKAPKK